MADRAQQAVTAGAPPGHRDTALGRFLGRDADRRMQPPPGIVYGLESRPPWPMAIGLALQHLAVQSIYFVLPIAIAAGFTSDATVVARFLSLSILAAALWQILQLLPRGPLGAGYPIPGTHTPALIGPDTLLAGAGGSFATAGAMALVAGAACLPLTFLMRRLRVVLPNEVAGVVVLLIGVALVGLGTQRLGLQAGQTAELGSAALVVAGSLAVMMLVSLSRTRASPFAVLVGAVFGVLLALALGHSVAGSAALLAGQSWLALPEPWVPDFSGISFATLLAFLIALVAVKATMLGNLLMFQRAADAGWTRPDAPPLRRGLLANGVGMMAAGMIGAAAPGPATAAVGLSIATGTLARRIAAIGAGLLALVAFCPKLVILFVLMPEPVKAAMLLYVGGFVTVQGGQLITSRLLDTRRTMVAALGLSAGLAVAIAPAAFAAVAPAIASPLSFGALVAFLTNLATLPFVRRLARPTLQVDAGVAHAVSDWCVAFGGAWGLKRSTANAAEHALIELAELLAFRGATGLEVAARLAEDRLEVTLRWDGAPLPAPSPRPDAQDLLGSTHAQEAFAVWLATRGAQQFSQRAAGAGTEARLTFED